MGLFDGAIDVAPSLFDFGADNTNNISSMFGTDSANASSWLDKAFGSASDYITPAYNIGNDLFNSNNLSLGSKSGVLSTALGGDSALDFAGLSNIGNSSISNATDTLSTAGDAADSTKKGADWIDKIFSDPTKAIGATGIGLKGIAGIYDAYNTNKYKQQMYNLETSSVNDAKDRRNKADESMRQGFKNSTFSKI